MYSFLAITWRKKVITYLTDTKNFIIILSVLEGKGILIITLQSFLFGKCDMKFFFTGN